MSNSFSLINDLVIPGLIIVAQIFAIILPVLLSVAFLVYAERKVLALIKYLENVILSFSNKQNQKRIESPLLL